MKRMMQIYIAVGLAVVAVCIFLLCRIKSGAGQAHSRDVVLYVGTYGDSIYRYIFDPDDFSFTPLGSAPAANASYLVLSDNDTAALPVIYSVSESGAHSGVCSYADDIAMTPLSFLMQTGQDPCHIMTLDMDRDTPAGTGPLVLTADYTEGSISVFTTSKGRIVSLSQQLRFTGKGPVFGRQESSHIHQLKVIPDSICAAAGIEGKWLLASDLGADAIRLLGIGMKSSSSLPLSHVFDIPCGSGSGPRHLEFDVGRNRLYCLTELSGELIVFDISSEDGIPVFTEIQRLKADEADAGGSADIHLHPSGRFLYTSHRLENDGISLFGISPSGELSRKGHFRTGRHPRNFVILPDGTMMLVACRDDRSVQIFSIDPDSGELSLQEGGLRFGKDMPVCLVF